MKRKIIIAVLLTFCIILAGAFSFAQPERENRRDNMRKKIHEKLNLTDEQQSQIEKLRYTHQEMMIDLKADLEKEELSLKELKNAGNYSRSEYIAKIEEIIAAHNNLRLAKANHHMDVYELLDAEQQVTWNEMKLRKERKHNKMKKHFKQKNRF